jgi:glycerol-3-phosphate dehydrogenase
MQRDLTRLVDETYDLLVVGAGIYGVTIAWDAAQRGLSVALVDRDDFGAATSFNSHKTVHGGLRSVQQGNLSEMREFVRERRALSRIAPHLVHPLPFLVPTTRDPLRSRAAFRLALTLHNLVSCDRNDQPDPSKHLPAGRLLSRQECLRRYPELESAQITGGALWHDCQMYSTDRVIFAFVHSALRAGAAVANYVRVDEVCLRDGRVRHVAATDARGPTPIEIRARLVVNAAGPWAGGLVGRLPGHPLRLAAARLSKAMNLVTSRPAPPLALGGIARGRYLFQVPWRGRAVFGTSHEPFDGDADSLHVSSGDVEAFLRDVDEAFPGSRPERGDITLVHRGLLPMVSARGDHVKLLKQSQIRDHRADGVEGLISVLGVRYTTARHTAERAVDLACARLGRPGIPCATSVTPLAGGAIDNFDAYLAQASAGTTSLSRHDLDRLVRSYGSEHGQIVEAIERAPEDGHRLGPQCAVTRAEIRRAARQEMACTLADAVLRRTEAGSAGHPGAEALETAADVMAAEQGWDRARRRSELDAVEAVYRVEDA